MADVKKVLDYDPVTGIKHTYHKDWNSGRVTIHTQQDAAQILESNLQDRLNDNGSWKGDLHKVASIPINVANAWMKELGDNPFAERNRKWLIAKLNSTEFKKFRTKGGNL